MLRAATVAAASEVVAAAHHAFTPYELGCWLSWLCEEGQELHGTARKHRTRGTVAY